MKQTLDIHDYYFGVLVATPEYLESSKRVRLLDGIDYDPFSEITDTEALIFGVTTLLKKETKDFFKEFYHYDLTDEEYNSFF